MFRLRFWRMPTHCGWDLENCSPIDSIVLFWFEEGFIGFDLMSFKENQLRKPAEGLPAFDSHPLFFYFLEVENPGKSNGFLLIWRKMVILSIFPSEGGYPPLF